jgi:hypothetical protein
MEAHPEREANRLIPRKVSTIDKALSILPIMAEPAP